MMLNLIRNIMKRSLFFLLSLLGFSISCEKEDGKGDNNGEQPCMYGTPTRAYTVRGKVTDSKGHPIKGIVVVSKNIDSFGNNPTMSAVTGSDGTFVTNTIKTMDLNSGVLTFHDVDGEQNGGQFKSQDVELSKLPSDKIADGDGNWFMGGYTLTADVKMEE